MEVIVDPIVQVGSVVTRGARTTAQLTVGLPLAGAVRRLESALAQQRTFTLREHADTRWRLEAGPSLRSWGTVLTALVSHAGEVATRIDLTVAPVVPLTVTDCGRGRIDVARFARLIEDAGPARPPHATCRRSPLRARLRWTALAGVLVVAAALIALGAWLQHAG